MYIYIYMHQLIFYININQMTVGKAWTPPRFSCLQELVPDAADPHLNRGAVYEALGRLEEALVDYDLVLRQANFPPRTESPSL